MIQKLIFGEPVETGAVVENILEAKGSLQFGKIVSKWPFEWEYSLEAEDVVYGLGESMRGINKRGGKYESWCSDCPNQVETTPSLYGAHNFVIVYGKQTFGLFFETPSKIEFDVGFTSSKLFTVKTGDTGVNLFVITPEAGKEESELVNIVRQFRKMIGQSYIPPRWGFGFQQSRWGYRNEKDVRQVVQKYKEANIPLDSICLDIDYMEEYEDFTIDTEKFPDLKGLCDDLKKDGIRLIPIIDAGVKVKKGYSVYDEGIEKDYFCKKEDGKTPYAAGVWPGRSHFTDFFRPEARAWFGAKYEVLTSKGVEGFWNDMNEPAMFYSDESLEQVVNQLKETNVENLDINSYFEWSGLSGSTSNRMDDYQRFYHTITDAEGNKKTYRHDKVHNMYGYLMTRAAGEGLSKISPEKRMLIYSRASTIGAHRYGGIWTGDVNSWWSHLEQHIKVLPSLNMVGFMYTGSDIGGFGDNTTRDLTLRWTQLGVFTPLMRNHSAWNTRAQECYSFEDFEDFRSVMQLRYALIPYLYSEFVKASVNNEMYFRPLSFDYPGDKIALETEDQLMLGKDIMIAPVYKQNVIGRYVYLPENMTKVTWINGKVEEAYLRQGIHYIDMPLDSVVFFVKENHMVPLCKPALCTDKINFNSFMGGVGTGKTYEMYVDDGYTRQITLEGNIHTITK